MSKCERLARKSMLCRKWVGSDNGCVIQRTLEQRYAPLIQLVHQLAQSVVANHTMKFGKYTGGSLQKLREEVWHSYEKDNVWLSFDALKITHPVTEAICGNRYSISLYTPGKLDPLLGQPPVGVTSPKTPMPNPSTPLSGGAWASTRETEREIATTHWRQSGAI